MSRPAVEVADILRAQGNRFLKRYDKSFSFQQLKAFRAIQHCRTAALGGLSNIRGVRLTRPDHHSSIQRP
jgi:hypothetical protein